MKNEDGQCFKLEQRSTIERHANISSVMGEMPQANERLNKRCLGGNPRISILIQYFNSVFQFSIFISVFSIQ
jgi:hypothetical protein